MKINPLIGIEREMAVFDTAGSPINIGKKIAAYGRKSSHTISFEAASNSYEIQTEPATLPETLEILDRAYDETIEYFKGLQVIGSSQPFSNIPLSDFGYFRLYQRFAQMYAPTNSIQLNMGVGDEDLILPMYNVMLILHPFLLGISQSAVIDGNRRGRVHFVNSAKRLIRRQLYYPRPFASLDEYQAFLNEAEELQEGDLNKVANQSFADRYKHEFRWGDSLKFRRFSPKYVFLPDRPRPDKKIPALGLEGCLETRSLDGTVNREFDKAFIELSVGLLLAYEPQELTPLDCERIQATIEDIPQNGLDTVWYINNEGRTVRDSMDDQLELAYNGLKTLGYSPIFLGLIECLKTSALDEFVFTNIQSLNKKQTVGWLAEQFKKNKIRF